MINNEVSKLAKYICSINNQLEYEAYAEQVNMLYGLIYEIGAFVPAMFDELVEIENSRIKKYGNGIVNIIANAEMLIGEYSKISFDLAQKGLNENRAFLVATPLKQIFSELISSKVIGQDTKDKLRNIISETELDFGYAAGNHNVASIRMAQVIRETKTENGGM